MSEEMQEQEFEDIEIENGVVHINKEDFEEDAYIEMYLSNVKRIINEFDNYVQKGQDHKIIIHEIEEIGFDEEEIGFDEEEIGFDEDVKPNVQFELYYEEGFIQLKANEIDEIGQYGSSFDGIHFEDCRVDTWNKIVKFINQIE